MYRWYMWFWTQFFSLYFIASTLYAMKIKSTEPDSELSPERDFISKRVSVNSKYMLLQSLLQSKMRCLLLS